MAGKTPATPKQEPNAPPETPQPDPLLMRQQQLQQQLQQVNKQIMDMRQQESMIKDAIQSASNQAQQTVGALNEIVHQQQNQK